MTLPRLKVATLSPSSKMRAMLRQLVEATTFGSVQLEVQEYCATFGDQPTRRLVEARPQIILIDMDNPKIAIRALSILHLELPEAWLFVTSESAELDSVLESIRAGAREYLPQPIQPDALSRALVRYITEHRPVLEGGQGAVYCIIPCKEGVGATCVSVNIAVTMAPFPDTRVALIDLNNPADVADYLNLKPQYTVVDALAAVSKLDLMLLETFMGHSHEVAVLAGPKESPSPPIIGREALFQMIQMVAKSYTHIFIDCPPSIDSNCLQVLSEVSSALIIVLTPEVPSLWRAGRVLRSLARAGRTEKIRLVVNRFTGKDDVDEKEIEKVLNQKVYWKLPNSYRASIDAINQGKPLVATSKLPLVDSYVKLVQQLTGKVAPKSTDRVTPQESSSWWRRVGSRS